MKNFFATLISWLAMAQGLDWLYQKFSIVNLPLLWALTVTTFFHIAYLGFFVCSLRVKIYSDRVEICAEAKKALEEQLLKNRKSSRKKT